jgi:hypothetical protein
MSIKNRDDRRTFNKLTPSRDSEKCEWRYFSETNTSAINLQKLGEFIG